MVQSRRNVVKVGKGPAGQLHMQPTASIPNYMPPSRLRPSPELLLYSLSPLSFFHPCSSATGKVPGIVITLW